MFSNELYKFLSLHFFFKSFHHNGRKKGHVLPGCANVFHQKRPNFTLFANGNITTSNFGNILMHTERIWRPTNYNVMEGPTNFSF
ncbi:hypothetical protein FKM82_024125 [Ascaphus truei]